MKITFRQIISAPWKGDNGITYSLFGLTGQGKVYRYSPGNKVWVALGMDVGEAASRYEVPETEFDLLEPD